MAPAPGRLLLLCAALLPLPAAAQVAAGGGALTSGQADPGDAAVVAILWSDHAVCSGVLVAPQVVLTAAHCVPPGAVREVGFGPDPMASDRREIESVDRLDDAPVPRTAWDLARLRLRGQPAGVMPLRLAGAAELAGGLPRAVRIVGFGHDSVAGEDAHQRRSGASLLSAVDERELHLVPGPSLPCLGDSGGPVLVADEAGEAAIGLVEGGDARCAASATAVRLDSQAAFLSPFLPTPAQGCAAGGGLPGRGTPAPLALLLVLVPVLRMRRRS